MAWIRGLLITAALILGLVGTLTAYVVPVDQSVVGLTLNAPAGNAAEPGEKPVPILTKGTKLTQEQVATLQAANVSRVKVKEFAFGRWTGVWLFVVGAIGMVVASFLRSKPRVGAAIPTGESAPDSPEQLLRDAREELRELHSRLPGMPMESDRLMLIRTRIERILQSKMAGVIAARPAMVSRIGLARYANFIEAFAGAERAMNRAWSAAADEHEPESRDSIATAERLLEEAIRRMS